MSVITEEKFQALKRFVSLKHEKGAEVDVGIADMASEDVKLLTGIFKDCSREELRTQMRRAIKELGLTDTVGWSA